jgi:hypothetical protein
MKSILKTLQPEFQLKNDETFTSEANTSIQRKLIPELLNALKPRYNPSYKELTIWLQSLHKHRRNRHIYKSKGKLDQDN